MNPATPIITSTYSRARHKIAAPLLFILLGIIYASWAARIPALRDLLQLSPSQLGFVLLSAGIGAVISFPLAAWLAAHCGARQAAWFSGLGLISALPLVALAPNMQWLMVAAFALGLGSGCFDVAINALGASHEKAAGRSTMSLLHAWFCLGTMSGALLGSAMAALLVSPLLHFIFVALFLLPLLTIAYRTLPVDKIEPKPATQYFAVPHGPLVALGIIGFCGAVAEGSIADWSGIFMKDQLQVIDGVAPLAYAVFAALMLLARLIGDRLKDRYGARHVVASGAWCATVGIFIAVCAINVPLTLCGFALAGAGLAAVFPFVFSAAARHGSTALAAVATFSYSGGLIGPPVIGFLAQGYGMRAGLSFIGVIVMLIAISSRRARWLE